MSGIDGTNGQPAGAAAMAARWPLGLGALAAGVAVAIGAAGAHGFREAGDPAGAALLDTASRYLMWHALGFLLLQGAGRAARNGAWIFFAGAILFAATLVGLAHGAPRPLGMLTPVGGGLMLVGWLWVAFRAVRPGRGD